MQNLFSVVVALIIALTGMLGGLPGTGIEQPVSVDLGVEMDGDLSALGEGASTVELLKGLISDITLGISLDPAGVAQLKASIGESQLLSFAVKDEGDSWSVVSSLFPSTLLTVKKETIRMMQGLASMSESGSPLSSLSVNIDEETGAAVGAAVLELIAAFESKAGEPETGSFTVGDVEFTQKTPYDLTSKEAVLLVMDTIKKIVSVPGVASLLSQLPNGFDPASIDTSIEEIKASEEENMPALSAARYQNEGGDSGLDVVLEKDGQSFHITQVSAAGIITINVDALDMITAVIKIDSGSRTFDLNASAANEGTTFDLAAHVAAGEDGAQFSFSNAMRSGENALSVKLNGNASSDAPVFEAAEDAKTVALESLLADVESQESTLFMAQIQISLATLIQTVTQEYPEIVKLMMPATTTAPVQ